MNFCARASGVIAGKCKPISCWRGKVYGKIVDAKYELCKWKIFILIEMRLYHTQVSCTLFLMKDVKEIFFIIVLFKLYVY